MSFELVTGKNGFVWRDSFLRPQKVTDDKRRSSVLPESMVAWRVGRLGRIGRKGSESRRDRDLEFGKWVGGGLRSHFAGAIFHKAAASGPVYGNATSRPLIGNWPSSIILIAAPTNRFQIAMLTAT